jgi:GNAT acetyltransferase-like protein
LGTRHGHQGIICYQNNKLAGYGIIRECREGYKAGPLLADDADTAENLFAGLRSLVPGSNIYLDIPLSNNNALDLVSLHRMAAVFEAARMYKGLAPALSVDNIYGVTSFELG